MNKVQVIEHMPVFVQMFMEAHTPLIPNRRKHIARHITALTQDSQLRGWCTFNTLCQRPILPRPLCQAVKRLVRADGQTVVAKQESWSRWVITVFDQTVVNRREHGFGDPCCGNHTRDERTIRINSRLGQLLCAFCQRS